jgi:hypothetical protein
MPICPALRVGLEASNLSRTSCHVSALWAKALSPKAATRNNPKQKRFPTPYMSPPYVCYILAGPNISRFVGRRPHRLRNALSRSVVSETTKRGTQLNMLSMNNLLQRPWCQQPMSVGEPVIAYFK